MVSDGHVLPFFPPQSPTPCLRSRGSVAGGWHGVRGKYPPRTEIGGLAGWHDDEGFGEVERRSARTGVSYRARYAMPDGTRYSRSFGTKMDAEAWLATERSLIDREEWTPPAARRKAAERRARDAGRNTVGTYAKRYVVERDLRPTTVRTYQTLLDARILPYFGEMPLRDVTLSEVKEWRAPSIRRPRRRTRRPIGCCAPSSSRRGGGADRPSTTKIRGAGTAPVRAGRRTGHVRRDRRHRRRDAQIDLRLFIVLAAFVGLREGELLELRRSDVDGNTGRINVTRKVDKDADPAIRGACPDCGRQISTPKTKSGVRTVHVPPPFLPMLQTTSASSTPPRDRAACCSPATAPTT